MTEWPDVDGLHNHVIETVPNEPLPDANRGSWYNPCATSHDGRHIATLLDANAVDVVHDLGAGDLRLSVYLGRCGYPVVAYETLSEITDVAMGWYGREDLVNVHVSNTDYYEDWRAMRESGKRHAYLAIGAANDLPAIPATGVAVTGYSEMGIECWIDGDRHHCDDCPPWWCP